MAVQTVTAAQIIVDTFDISGFVGNITDTPGSFTVQEVPNFGARGFMQRRVALRSGMFGIEGYADHDATGVSALLPSSVLGSSLVTSVCIPTTGYDVAVGDHAMFASGLVTAYSSAGAAVGEAAPIKLGMDTSGAFIAGGYCGAPLASRTTSGFTGAGVNVVGPSATQRMYAVLQVTAAAGTDLAVKVQSDDNSGFTSATDRITFSTVSAIGTQVTSVAGSLATETYWRVVATVASSTFSFAVYIGVA